MAKIQHLLDKIRTAIYGKEVRGSLADGLEAINKETEDATEVAVNVEQRQDTVEQQFDDVLAGYSEDRPISNEETIAARTNRNTNENYGTIGQRLDAENKKVNAQLAETTNKLHFIKKIIVSIEDFGASPATNFDSTTAIQNAIDFVSNLGGGEVRLPPGRFRTSNKLILRKNVALIGANMESTVIQIFSDTNDHVVELESIPWKTGATYQRIENITIDGNKAEKTGAYHGIYVPSSVTYTYINNVEVRNCSGDGIKYISSHRNILKNTISRNNNGNGVTITSEYEEGIGSVTDNHVEMGYITSSNNGGNGFNFIRPVDIRCIHLSSMTNARDGLYIENPSGGWCNTLDTIMSQGDLNGVRVVGGSALTINNLSVSQPSERCLHIENLDHSLINNVFLRNGSLGNMYLFKLGQSNISNIISILGNSTQSNIDMSNSRFTNFSNVKVIGGLHGILLRNDSSENNFSNIYVREVDGCGIICKGDGEYKNRDNSYNNIHMKRIGSADNNYTSAFYLRFAPRTKITGFRNTEDRPVINIDYGIDLSTSEQCILSNSTGLGDVAGFRLHIDNESSIVSDTIIGEVVYNI